MMIRPHPRRVIAGKAALVTKNALVRLRASEACQVCGLITSAAPDSKTGLAVETMPALLTTMSNRPQRCSAADTSSDAASVSVRSATIPATSKPVLRSAVTLASILAVVALIITAAPSSASSLAVAKPMPSALPAPVTTATRPDRSNTTGIGICPHSALPPSAAHTRSSSRRRVGDARPRPAGSLRGYGVAP